MAVLQKVVIIGAGPAGLLLAHYLLRRGKYEVVIYERRPDPRLVDSSQDRTFPISLQERGRKALRSIPGLEDAVAAESVFCNGTMVYNRQGKPRTVPRKNANLTIDRNRLVLILLQRLVKTYPVDRLTVQFNCDCTQIAHQTKTVTLQPQPGEPFNISFDRLVGADGARSGVREDLVKTAELQCELTYLSDAYKSVFLRRSHPELGIKLAPDKIHAWTMDDQTRLLMVPQPGNRLNGVIIFAVEQSPLQALSTPQDVKPFFQEKFPLFGPLMSDEEATAFFQRPVSRVLTLRCDRFHQGDSVLILGDAAHAVSPSVGQGCNASLEDVQIVDRLLDQYEDDWAKMLPAFSQQRVPDAHALQELSNYSFPRTKALVIEFFLRLSLSRLLRRWFPNRVKPFVFDLVLDTDLPYSEVLSLSQSWIEKVKRSRGGKV